MSCESWHQGKYPILRNTIWKDIITCHGSSIDNHDSSSSSIRTFVTSPILHEFEILIKIEELSFEVS